MPTNKQRVRISVHQRRHGPRRLRGGPASLALIAALGPLLAGCPDDVQREFRAAAGSSLQQGVNAILDGFVDGFFAVFEPEDAPATGG